MQPDEVYSCENLKHSDIFLVPGRVKHREPEEHTVLSLPLNVASDPVHSFSIGVYGKMSLDQDTSKNQKRKYLRDVGLAR